MKFKVGDRVKLIAKRHGDYSSNPVWGGKCGKVTGTIKSINSGYLISGQIWIDVGWDNGHSNCYFEIDLSYLNGDIRSGHRLTKIFK